MQVAWLAHWLIQPPRCSNIKILWGPSIAGVDTVSAHQSRIEEEPMAPSVFHASPEQPATVLPDLTLYASLELSRSTWLVTCLLPDRDKMSKYSTPGGDGGALLGLLERMRARAQQLTGRPVDIVAIQEAGLDGFWVHRLLEANGVESHVVDPASIAVPRRHRRAKTDAIDGETLLRTLMAWQRGEPRGCSMTVPPSPSEEDRRRISRERATLLRERIQHTNRIRGLLFGQGITNYNPLHKNRRACLEELRTGVRGSARRDRAAAGAA